MDELGSTRCDLSVEHGRIGLPPCIVLGVRLRHSGRARWSWSFAVGLARLSSWLIPQILRLAEHPISERSCFPEETRGKENVQSNFANSKWFVKPLQEKWRVVDKLREICAVVPVNRVSGNGRSEIAQNSTRHYP